MGIQGLNELVMYFHYDYEYSNKHSFEEHRIATNAADKFNLCSYLLFKTFSEDVRIKI